MINKKFPELDYDPETGILTWVKRIGMRIKPGMEAGSPTWNGYRSIFYKGKMYRAHRLAWEIYYGTPPAGQIDHINRNKIDNRIKNLRDVTNQQNQWNRVIRSKNRAKGVRFVEKEKKWIVSFIINGKRKRLGRFDCLHTANEYAKQKVRELHGEFSIY